MRRRVLGFLFAALLVLAMPPVLNLLAQATAGPAASAPGERWWSRQVLYRFDAALGLANRVLWRMGLSTDPQQVVVGRDGWLYLGDRHQRSISAKREGAGPAMQQRARDIGLAMAQWEGQLKSQGVRGLRVLLAPDKSTLYPEHLPAWAANAPESPADALLHAVPAGLVVDLRPVLAAARATEPEPLYYRTDTHWTRRGAWLGYQALAAALAPDVPGVRWLTAPDIAFADGGLRHGGDLARFLWLGDALADHDEAVRIRAAAPPSVELVEHADGRVAQSGGNPEVGAPERWILARTRGALNPTRVLWLRDSFGTALSPFMAATFAEVLQIHPFAAAADRAALAEVVRRFRPELVVVTVVERNALEPWFAGPFVAGTPP